MGCGCSASTGAGIPQAAGVSLKEYGSCPSGHKLHLQERPSWCDGCTCDVCGDEIPKGEYVWGCRACDYDKCIQCARRWAASQAQAPSPDTPQQAPTLLTGGAHSGVGKYKNFPLRAVLEEYNAMFDGSNSKDQVGEFVNDVYVKAFGITHQGAGRGASGECPFASAYEVHIFYQFCLKVCVAWSEHVMGKDEHVDNAFYAQISDLSAILCFLDTDAVPLPEEIDQNIKILQRDALYPHWVDGEIAKGKQDALECVVNVGRKWKLEETQAFQKAVAALVKCNVHASELASVETQ